MEFKKYQHIEKIGASEVEGILRGEVHLSYKIDGTNGCIYFDNGTIKFGSRNRSLSIDNDNCKFMNSLTKNEAFMDKIKQYFNNYPNRIIYGEWLVPVNIKRYKKDAWNKFYIFDVFDSENQTYLRYDKYAPELTELGLSVIPEIAVLNNPSEEDIKNYLNKTGDFLVDNGMGEGIVIKNYDYKNIYGRTTWAKILTEDFVIRKIEGRRYNADNKIVNLVEYKIISKFLTPEHILKEKEKMIERYQGWSNKYMQEFLNRCFLEFYKDNWEIILNKLHDPTINFKVLRKLSSEKIKEVIGY